MMGADASMVNLLPAILIGGPPHAGKSVLTYSISQALRKRNVDHFVIRACPDGEGDWSQEIDQRAVKRIRFKGDWTPEFVKNICLDLERRHFPLLVDIGGHPEQWQTVILRHCTHSLLLLHADKENTANFWRRLVATYGLLPLAQLYSVREGISTITAETPIVAGTLAGLNRNTLAQGPLFDLLVERIVSLFTSYSSTELRRGHMESAPGEVVDLDTLIQAWAPQSKRWQPGMLAPLFERVPQDRSLAVYGRGTNWLYAALAIHTNAELFYQFDSRLGWTTPLPIQFGLSTSPEVRIVSGECNHLPVLSVHPANDHIDYEQVKHLSFPSMSSGQGLILSGKLPVWLVTALARLYNRAGLLWLACYHPQLEGAVVIYSRTKTYVPGDLIPMSAS
jgi:CRISPR-associated protein Csx3